MATTIEMTAPIIKRAARQLIHQYNREHSHKKFYLKVITRNVSGDPTETYATAERALALAGSFYRLRDAKINIYGAVFVNGKACGYIV